VHWPITEPAFTSVSALTAAMKAANSAGALVVMGAPLDLSGLHRQKRLRAVERLDLALFVDADHQRFLRRIEIETDNVAHLFDELRVRGQLECLGSMGLQGKGAPDAMNRGR
jgi:hypothetical protein